MSTVLTKKSAVIKQLLILTLFMGLFVACNDSEKNQTPISQNPEVALATPGSNTSQTLVDNEDPESNEEVNNTDTNTSSSNEAETPTTETPTSKLQQLWRTHRTK